MPMASPFNLSGSDGGRQSRIDALQQLIDSFTQKKTSSIAGTPGGLGLGGGPSGSSGGGPGLGGSPGSTSISGVDNPGAISGITGYDPNVVGLGLSAMAAVPGSQGWGALNQAMGAANFFGIGPSANLTDSQGNAVSYTGPNSLMGLIGSIFSGKTPSFTAVGPNGELSAITTDRSGETGAMGLGAQAAFDAVGRGESPYGPTPTQGPVPSFQGRTGIGVDEGAPGPAPAPAPTGPPGQDSGGFPGVSDTPGGGGGGGGGGAGDSVICTLLGEKGLVDRATLRANNRFRLEQMSPEQIRGYHAWARPLVTLCRRSPRTFRYLYKALGWMTRAYMAEIREPGSSRAGRVILRVGLPLCGLIGKLRGYSVIVTTMMKC